MKITTIVFLFLFALLQPLKGHAQATADAPGTPQAAAAPVPAAPPALVTTSSDFSGSRLSYPVQIIATVYDSKGTVCLPANIELRGLGLLTSAGVPVKLRATKASDIDPEKYPLCDSGQSIKLADAIGRALIIDEKTTKIFTPRSNGLTYGVLVVPFKYYVNGSRDFKGAGTVGPYAGWKTQSSGLAAGVEFVGFAGLGAVTSEKIIDGKTESESLAAFSYGFAAIGRIRNNFQIGVVAGQDRVGKSSQYKDNGKWWIALSVGYPFSN